MRTPIIASQRNAGFRENLSFIADITTLKLTPDIQIEFGALTPMVNAMKYSLLQREVRTMKDLKRELRKATRKELEMKRLSLFEVRQKGNRKQDRRYAQLTETIDSLNDTRKRMKQ